MRDVEKMQHWRLLSDNGNLIHQPTAQLSTVAMPFTSPWLLHDFGYAYESCIFYLDGNSEVVARYNSELDAAAGHHQLCRHHGLTRHLQRDGKHNV
jgi:hypothetical protein